jgi:hypothetical protein
MFEDTMRHGTHQSFLRACVLCAGLLLAEPAPAETLRQPDSAPQDTAGYGHNSPRNAAAPAMPAFAGRPAPSSGRPRIGGDQAFWNNGRAPRVNPHYEQGFKERYRQMMQGSAPAEGATDAGHPPVEE